MNTLSKIFFFGVSACECDAVGTKPNTVCSVTDGQCDCQQFVNSRRCDECIDNYYDLQITGCKGKKKMNAFAIDICSQRGL